MGRVRRTLLPSRRWDRKECSGQIQPEKFTRWIPVEYGRGSVAKLKSKFSFTSFPLAVESLSLSLVTQLVKSVPSDTLNCEAYTRTRVSDP